jgi:hypothetical protein
MPLTPIGVVTRNRHKLLDVTLRAISATVPVATPVVVFDDASDSKDTLAYLYTDQKVRLSMSWPNDDGWRMMGLHTIKAKGRGLGICSKIHVCRLSDERLGVVNASCLAFVWMVRKFGRERGILMVQDDVAFVEGWFDAIREAAQHPRGDRQQPVGLVCGCWLNKSNKEKTMPMTYTPKGGITAQCYYITPEGIDAVLPWASELHSLDRGFDNKFCAHVRSNGADVYRMHPAICQHIGIQSTVRHGRGWCKRGVKGRVDYSCTGPYPLAKYVRNFKKEVGDE